MENHIPNNETRFLFAPYTKINSKWIKDLNIRPEIISYINENKGTKTNEPCSEKEFYEFDPKDKGSKSKNK